MRILLSAYACEPGRGSEPGVGWRWALELRREHELLVLTHARHRAAIERELSQRGQVNPTFVYRDKPWLLRWLPFNSITAHVLYFLWQFSILPLALRLHRERPFDVIHHITFGTFRYPCFLGWLGAPLVLGPVGGGERAPGRLLRDLGPGERLREKLRDLVICSARADPLLALALSRSRLILCKTAETVAALPSRYRGRAVVCQEIGAPEIQSQTRPAWPAADGCFSILYAGRLLGWKGVHFALAATSLLVRQGYTVRLVIAGQGRLDKWLKQLASRLGIEQCVDFRGQLTRQELFSTYQEAHCFLFPSLHDSSGNVVLEAMAHGAPVVCLDLGGPRYFVTGEAGCVIATGKSSVDAVVTELATALGRLYSSSELLGRLSQGAIARAQEFSWEQAVKRAYGLIAERVPGVSGMAAAHTEGERR